jgi:hypothetical protein
MTASNIQPAVYTERVAIHITVNGSEENADERHEKKI